MASSLRVTSRGVFAFFLWCICATAHGANWYDDAPSNCSGSTVVSVVAGVNALITWKSPVTQSGAPNHLIYPLPPNDFRQLQANPYLEKERVVLDAITAASLRNVVKAATDTKVPLFFKAVVAVFANAVVSSALPNVGIGLLFDTAYSSLDASAVAFEQLLPLIADGGVLTRAIEITTTASGSRFIVLSTRYSVAVGNEKRSAAFSACLLPAPISTKQFLTTGPYNNKRVEQRPDGTWAVWDIEDAKWDKKTLTFVSQDPDYYYFTEPEFTSNVVTGTTTHRLSVVGGAWQRKSSTDSAFKTLYQIVNAQ